MSTHRSHVKGAKGFVNASTHPLGGGVARTTVTNSSWYIDGVNGVNAERVAVAQKFAQHMSVAPMATSCTHAVKLESGENSLER